jgi:hypothetical protein
MGALPLERDGIEDSHATEAGQAGIIKSLNNTINPPVAYGASLGFLFVSVPSFLALSLSYQPSDESGSELNASSLPWLPSRSSR